MNKKFLVAIACWAMLVCCNKETKTTTETTNTTETAEGTADKGQVSKEIQSLEDDFMSSMNARNTNGMDSFYADDARSYMFGKPVVAGKPAIIEGIQKGFATMPEGAKLSISQTEVMVASDGKQAVEIGGYKMSDAKGTTLNSGHYFGYFEKRNGRFVCVREMVTETPKAVQKPSNQKT